jgi:hypothetical protein
MNDRELLELAARAGGMGELVFLSETQRYAVVWLPVGADNNEWCFWNPIVDDGDALRLAVKLELDLLIYADGAEVLSKTSSPILEDAYKDHGMDVCAATRRAIVRAAAAIGAAL